MGPPLAGKEPNLERENQNGDTDDTGVIETKVSQFADTTKITAAPFPKIAELVQTRTLPARAVVMPIRPISPLKQIATGKTMSSASSCGPSGSTRSRIMMHASQVTTEKKAAFQHAVAR